MTSLVDLQKTVQDINNAQYKTISDLVVGHKYAIKKLEPVKVGGLDRFCVYCRDFKLALPEAISARILQKHVQQINESNTIMVYIVYNGIKELANGKRKIDLILTLDSEVE
ncbi:MAG: hypothetical protein E6K54_08515 [Gammaproteobacteria bacterium]|nr:MAG: hypothetical protein E6K54_08515 [Gammaproteobacteria bacterium]